MKTNTCLLTLVTCAMLPAAGLAQDAPKKEKKKPDLVETDKLEKKIRAPRTPMSVAQIQGARVKNKKGIELGHVEKIVADRDTGNIRLVLISVGGFLGIGDKLVAVPWSALSSAGSRGDLVLDASKGELETAPGVKDSKLTQASYKEWLDWANGYFGPDKKGRIRAAQPVEKKEKKKAAGEAVAEKKPAAEMTPEKKAARPRATPRPAAEKAAPAPEKPAPAAESTPAAAKPSPTPEAAARPAPKATPKAAKPTPTPVSGTPAAM